MDVRPGNLPEPDAKIEIVHSCQPDDDLGQDCYACAFAVAGQSSEDMFRFDAECGVMGDLPGVSTINCGFWWRYIPSDEQVALMKCDENKPEHIIKPCDNVKWLWEQMRAQKKDRRGAQPKPENMAKQVRQQGSAVGRLIQAKFTRNQKCYGYVVSKYERGYLCFFDDGNLQWVEKKDMEVDSVTVRQLLCKDCKQYGVKVGEEDSNSGIQKNLATKKRQVAEEKAAAAAQPQPGLATTL